MTAPVPVETAQPISAALSSGMSSRILMALSAETMVWVAYVAGPMWVTSWPRTRRRVVPSSITPRAGRRSHSCGRPVAQYRHRPHAGDQDRMT